MVRKDFEEVIEIEKFLHGKRAWTEKELTKVLAQRSNIGFVVEYDYNVVGYMIYEMRDRSFNLINFGVSPWYQNCGLGRLLLGKLLAKADTHSRRNKVTAMVSEKNLEGLKFLKNNGFIAKKIKKQPYDNYDEDGIWMVYK